MMKRVLSPLQQLRWKMTLSYTAVTVGALLVVEILLIIIGFAILNALMNSALLPNLLVEELQREVSPLVRPYLQEPTDIEGLEQMLNRFTEVPIEAAQNTFVISFDDSSGWLFVLDESGDLLILQPANDQRPDVKAIDGIDAPIQAALEGDRTAEDLYVITDEWLVVVVPVEEEGEILGVVGIIEQAPSAPSLFSPELLSTLGISLVVFTILAGITGTVFGFITARGLTRRLDRLANATQSWSQGDFSTFVQDKSGDEISQLAYRLNRMAEQLQNLLETRKRLAVLEERNRLARDLHDSAKQQAFAASAQIGAAHSLLNTDVEAAREHLAEAEDLVDVLRQELTNLINELRPVALDDEGLSSAIRAYVQDWSRRTAISAEVTISGERSLAYHTEQALFRIMQEALSNVARHSQAEQVTVQLHYQPEGVMLVIQDDGTGFDPEKIAYGFGLRSMQERVSHLPNGSLTIDSAHGTTIKVECDDN